MSAQSWGWDFLCRIEKSHVITDRLRVGSRLTELAAKSGQERWLLFIWLPKWWIWCSGLCGISLRTCLTLWVGVFPLQCGLSTVDLFFFFFFSQIQHHLYQLTSCHGINTKWFWLSHIYLDWNTFKLLDKMHHFLLRLPALSGSCSGRWPHPKRAVFPFIWAHFPWRQEEWGYRIHLAVCSDPKYTRSWAG